MEGEGGGGVVVAVQLHDGNTEETASCSFLHLKKVCVCLCSGVFESTCVRYKVCTGSTKSYHSYTFIHNRTHLWNT